MTDTSLFGLHHVTAICSDAQQNVDFYTGALGLRLIKLTVNYDDPTAYHLYYGDAVGTPGTVITFFPYGKGPLGARGAGAFGSFTLGIPMGTMGFWESRLREFSPVVKQDTMGITTLTISDPDRLPIRLQEIADSNPEAYLDGAKRSPNAIQRVIGVTLDSRTEGSAKFLEGALHGSLARSEPLESGYQARIYEFDNDTVKLRPNSRQGMGGPGTIHHVALGVVDDEAQKFWLDVLHQRGTHVSEIKDRQYFHSIYFREPGGALFEIATRNPGFTVDETVAELGSSLKLPPFLEGFRDRLEVALPRLNLPTGENR